MAISTDNMMAIHEKEHFPNALFVYLNVMKDRSMWKIKRKGPYQVDEGQN
ncbi:hypothetical protein GJU40_19320 [Bacillus lacus]|uniref:Uncharacterized protein n=1 Tax=Metabacillus lacus TaxID=1983721 RepID=A0A7X2M162_9BACI|nr:hypothetical protein [Metabacillus lacus]MRX74272.1 hypothetical protein [Metabacillus lacus]